MITGSERVLRMTRPLAALFVLTVASCAPEATPDTLVYVTDAGARYHRKECRLKTGSHGVRLGDLPKKYRPCKQCDPPVLTKG